MVFRGFCLERSIEFINFCLFNRISLHDLWILEAHTTHLDGLLLGRSWLDLPGVTAATIPVIGIIAEMTGPRRVWAPAGAGASYSLALRATLCLPKAKTILHIWVDLCMCLNPPLVTAASSSVVGVISKRLGPSRDGTPSTASVRWTLALGTAFSFFETNPESVLSPALWEPPDYWEQNYGASIWHG